MLLDHTSKHFKEILRNIINAQYYTIVHIYLRYSHNNKASLFKLYTTYYKMKG